MITYPGLQYARGHSLLNQLATRVDTCPIRFAIVQLDPSILGSKLGSEGLFCNVEPAILSKQASLGSEGLLSFHFDPYVHNATTRQARFLLRHRLTLQLFCV
jgi:hypothetical protein